VGAGGGTSSGPEGVGGRAGTRGFLTGGEARSDALTSEKSSSGSNPGAAAGVGVGAEEGEGGGGLGG
jgi:hypothetical protein